MNFFHRSISTPDVKFLQTANDNNANSSDDQKQQQQPENDCLININQMDHNSLCNKPPQYHDFNKVESWKHCGELVEKLESFASLSRKQNSSLDTELSFETINSLSIDAQNILERLVFIDPVNSQSFEMKIRILRSIRDISKSNQVLRFLLSNGNPSTPGNPSLFDQWISLFISIVKHSCSEDVISPWTIIQHQRQELIELCLELILDILKLDEPPGRLTMLVKSCHKYELIDIGTRFCQILNGKKNRFISCDAMRLGLRCINEISKQIMVLNDRLSIIKLIVLPMKQLECFLAADWALEWPAWRHHDPNNFTSKRRYLVHEIIQSSSLLVDEILLTLCADPLTLIKTIEIFEDIMALDLAKQRPETRAAALRMLAVLDPCIEISRQWDYRRFIVSQYLVPMLKSKSSSCLKLNACWTLCQEPYASLHESPGSARKSLNLCSKRLLKLAIRDSRPQIRAQAQIALAHLCLARPDWKLAKKWAVDCSLQVNSTIDLLFKPKEEFTRILDTHKNYLLIARRIELISRLFLVYRKWTLVIMIKNLDIITEYLSVVLRHQDHMRIPPDPRVPLMILQLMISIVRETIKDKNRLSLSDIEANILESVKVALSHASKISHKLIGVSLELLSILTSKLITKRTLNSLDQLNLLIKKYPKVPGCTLFSSMSPILYNLITDEPKVLLINSSHMQKVIHICRVYMLESESYDDRALAVKLLEIILLENDDTNYPSRRSTSQDGSMVVEWVANQLFEEFSDWRSIYESNENPFANRLIPQSRQNYRNQLLMLICMSFGNNLHGTLEIINKQEPHKKLPKSWLLDLLVHFLLEPSNELCEDYYWPQHESRIMIKALCSLIKLPHNHRPESLIARSGHLLPKAISVFEFLHRMYEEHYRELGSTMRIKYDEPTYLNWQPNRAGYLQSKIDRERGFYEEINCIRYTLKEAQQNDNSWHQTLHQSLTRSQQLLLKDVLHYINSENSSPPVGCFRRMSSIRKSKLLPKMKRNSLGRLDDD